MSEQEVRELIHARIAECVAAIEGLADEGIVAAIERAATIVTVALERGGKLLVFGNGGSAADAEHIAAELVGRYLRDRRPLAALALVSGAPALTAIANDYGYDAIFARQVEALGAAGDVALGITTSGASTNVVRGLAAARERGLATIAFTGPAAGAVGELCDVCIAVAAVGTPRIQEAHGFVGHLLCELVESRLT